MGQEMHSWAQDLWPMPRSLTGAGVRATLEYVGKLLPGLTTTEIPSGTQVMDWQVPSEWRVNEAHITAPNGERIADWRSNNLHLVGYSTAINATLSREELDSHLYSIESLPDAIPYVTSYYEKRWGFCLSHAERMNLPLGDYQVVVDTELFDGHLTFGDLVIPGMSEQEIVFSTYICHPSMANNELSGIVVATALAQWIMKREKCWYSYRFIFVPETIGSLCYMDRNLDHLKSCVRAGWVVSCVGDEGPYSVIPSRTANVLSERILLRALNALNKAVVRYSWLERGSDERQWCAPGVDLPMCGFSRSKYGMFPEYHTSLDDLSLVTARGLEDSLAVLQECVRELESGPRFLATTLGEPQMGRRGMYPTLSNQSGGAVAANKSAINARSFMDVLSYCDGNHDRIDIGSLLGIEPADIEEITTKLVALGLLSRS